MNRRTTTRKCHREGKSGSTTGGSTAAAELAVRAEPHALNIGRVGQALHGVREDDPQDGGCLGTIPVSVR